MGNVTYTKASNANLSPEAQEIANAIDDHSIVVQVMAEDTKITSNKQPYIGGAMMGNTVTSDVDPKTGKNIVKANQEINPKVLSTYANANGKSGYGILHEISEAYQGGLLSQASGISSPAANQPGSVYQQAHDNAIPQPGVIEVTYRNQQGLVVFPLFPGTIPPDAKE
jgi:hypothetical protein